MTDRYAQIRDALAMGPTPGPWEALSNFVRTHFIQGEMGGFMVAECPANIGRELEDAAHIAACDPDTIRELLAERDALAAAMSQAPAAGEEIMVNAAHDVYTLPLQPSGLSSGPRFVVHVPGPEQPAPQAQSSTEAWRDLAIAGAAIVEEIREIVGLKGKPGDVVEAVRELAAPKPDTVAGLVGKAYAGCTIWRGSLRVSVTETEAIEHRIDADEAFCDLAQRALDSLAAAWDAAALAAQPGGSDNGR